MEQNKSKNNERSILPSMVKLTLNSHLTQSVARTLSEKLTPKEFEDFRRWLIEAEEKHRVNIAKKFLP